MEDDTARSDRTEGRIAILMTVFNGGQFLQEQIDSLARQTVGWIDVWVSDDGSGDRSPALLRQAALDWKKGDFHVLEGPRRGFAENFRSLMVNPAIDADHFAFCDQDDLWDEDKLADAVGWLRRQPSDRPALYCTRTRTVSVEGRTVGLSPLFAKPPGFRNALVQSIAGANTMVMNRAAWQLVREASRRTGFVSHDWWCYLIVTGAGGVVHYSPVARIGYRQHAKNLVGENNSWRARMSRLSHLMKGRFVRWNDRNLAGLAACEDLLTPETRDIIRLFSEARSRGLPARLAALVRTRVYRQTTLGQAGLYLACILRRM